MSERSYHGATSRSEGMKEASVLFNDALNIFYYIPVKSYYTNSNIKTVQYNNLYYHMCNPERNILMRNTLLVISLIFTFNKTYYYTNTIIITILMQT